MPASLIFFRTLLTQNFSSCIYFNNQQLLVIMRKLRQVKNGNSSPRRLLTALFLFVALVLSANRTSAQTNPVTGHVTDEAGKALANVSVTVKGSKTGTTTDENGNFKLTV